MAILWIACGSLRECSRLNTFSVSEHLNDRIMMQ